MAFPAIPSRVVCPRCKQPFIVQLRTIIDVGQEPELKERFLAGEVNRAQCPHCGSNGLLSTPLLYHDPSKELLISFVPPEMNLPAEEQERLIGSLVNTVMNSVPPEQRKAYFLHPKTVLTLESLYDAILEADGISKEALEAQRALIRLIDDLVAALEDEAAFDRLVSENRQRLDYTFFLTLSEFIDMEAQRGSRESAEKLQTLRDRLLERVSLTAAPKKEATTFDEFLEILQKAQGGPTWSETIALNLPRLDYAFFQTLTARIEEAERQGDAEKAKALSGLREAILAEIDAQRNRLREAEDEASLLVMELLEADDLPAAIRAHRQEIDEIFFIVLSRLYGRASARNDTRRMEQFERLSRLAQEVLEEDLPPALRLIGRLLRADYPEETGKILEEHRVLLNEEFLKLFDAYANQYARAGDEAFSKKLQDLRGQIVAKMTIQRA